MTIDGLVHEAIKRYLNGTVLYSRLVLELERAVDMAEDTRDPRADDLRRLWGQLEIVNALNENATLTARDLEDTGQILSEIRTLLAAPS